MKRHPALHPLSRHHHFVLVRALELRRAAESAPAVRAAKARAAAESFLSFWERHGQLHFREEEDVLLPAYAAVANIEEDAGVLRTLAQHARIRALAVKLKKALPSDECAPIAGQLGSLLYDHVRLEEDVIFPQMERILGDAALREAGAYFTELHPQRPKAKES